MLEPKSTVPFYPIYKEVRKEKEDKDQEEMPVANRLICRVAGTSEVTAPYCYSALQSTLLDVRNKFTGIYVATQVR